MRKHSIEKIKTIKRLRRAGHSINELVREFSMPKSTIWHHIRNVTVLPKYKYALRLKQGGSRKKALLEWEKSRQEAATLIPKLNTQSKLLIAASLYWGEGAKGDFTLSNTDPELIKTFIYCLKEMGVEKNRLSVNIRVYEDLNTDKAREFWSKTTGIPKNEIKYVNVLYGKKRGKLPYGMCRVRVKKGAYLFKVINSIKETICNIIEEEAQRPHRSMDRTRVS